MVDDKIELENDVTLALLDGLDDGRALLDILLDMLLDRLLDAVLDMLLEDDAKVLE